MEPRKEPAVHCGACVELTQAVYIPNVWELTCVDAAAQRPSCQRRTHRYNAAKPLRVGLPLNPKQGQAGQDLWCGPNWTKWLQTQPVLPLVVASKAFHRL